MPVIIERFLCWTETAKAGDRAKAANALGRAYLKSDMTPGERQSADLAMTYLLDDPSPLVRKALADALAGDAEAPHAVILCLASDQDEIASEILLRSPVLTDGDLVELAGRGSSITRSLIATRRGVSRSVAAAIAEVGDQPEIISLLENDSAGIAGFSLLRIAERFGDDGEVRSMLLERPSLPSKARQLLVQHVGEALAGFGFVSAAIGRSRTDRVVKEAGSAATLAISAGLEADDLRDFAEHLRQTGRLTPALLMQALVSGRLEFFAAAIINLSGCEDRRARAVLASGRMHAVRALFEAAGISRAISPIFVEAAFLWRGALEGGYDNAVDYLTSELMDRFRHLRGSHDEADELLDIVSKLHIEQKRRLARLYAEDAAIKAA
jgi:uncharacterized protein (DUF2336 family)